MTDQLSRLTQLVHSKLQLLGFSSPRESVIRALIDTAHLASLRTEEGRFVRGSLTFADPRKPDIDPPLTRRADYPDFTRFRRRLPLTVEILVKLSRAIDKWCGSIVAYGTTRSNLVAWAVVDQLVHQNVRLNREGEGGAANPGILTITMDAVGDLSIYHGILFLGGLRQGHLVTHENNALRSDMVAARVTPALKPAASSIARVLGRSREKADVPDRLFSEWSNTLARLCIGLRRLSTGGAFLISPSPIWARLDVIQPFPYRRLGDSLTLRVLDEQYRRMQLPKVRLWHLDSVPKKLVTELALAEADAEDRERELTGAVRIVTSLAAVDGLVLLDPSLRVIGFGVKIRSESSIGNVYDGLDFLRRGTQAKRIDPSRFGTRHGSMLRYCRADRHALGVVVSQDGHVRLIMRVGQNLTLWDNVQLLDYEYDVRRYDRESRRGREYRNRRRQKEKRGYTRMPKTIEELMCSRTK
jgi:hypothetical protein